MPSAGAYQAVREPRGTKAARCGGDGAGETAGSRTVAGMTSMPPLVNTCYACSTNYLIGVKAGLIWVSKQRRNVAPIKRRRRMPW